MVYLALRLVGPGAPFPNLIIASKSVLRRIDRRRRWSAAEKSGAFAGPTAQGLSRRLSTTSEEHAPWNSRARRPRKTSRLHSPVKARPTAAICISHSRPISRATTTWRRCSARPPRARPATGLPIGDTVANLKASIAGETHEYTDMYPGMTKTARDEGFDETADWFETLAKAEKMR